MIRHASPLAALILLSAAGYGNAQPAPIEYHKLANGLRVVLSRDTTSPLARMGVYYHVGPVHEPPGRAGFAHLFEHFMFEGSANLAPGEYFDLVVSNGGRFGARTLYDFTKFNATVPKNALRLMLWAEADRMRGLRFDSARFEAVRSVVKNEVRQQAFDRPYGRFVWIDLREAGFTRWENAHSIYGDTPDGKMDALDAATLQDARAFFETYYVPDNAVLVVYGDINTRETLSWINEYFANIPRGKRERRSVPAEPPRTSELRVHSIDKNASNPALAVAYRLPPRSSPAFWAMGVINQLLAGGRDAWLFESMVERGLTDGIFGEISPRHGSMYTVGGPNFWAIFLWHDAQKPVDALLAAIDTQVTRVRTQTLDSATLSRAITKLRTQFYGEWDAGRGDGRVDLLGQFALFDDDPSRLNRLDSELRGITADVVLKTARDYLNSTNRVILTLTNKAAVQ
jgi:predicted Zn-dependent peptidase